MEIYKIGLEIEGGIDYRDLESLQKKFKNITVKSDSSVYVPNNNDSSWKNNAEVTYCGFKHNVLRFLNAIWSTSLVQNPSCGNHVHFSFKNFEKAQFLFQWGSVWEKFIDDYVQKFCEGKRLSQNKYARRLYGNYSDATYDESTFDDFYKGYDINRYKMINYMSIPKHNTIEFRILPHFEGKEEAINSTLWLIEWVEDAMRGLQFEFELKRSIHLNEEIWDFPPEIDIEIIEE